MAVELETRVAVLENNLDKMGSFFDRLDTTMEKLTEVSSSIKELLAVHELKINRNEDTAHQITTLLETRRIQSETQHALIQKNIADSEKEMKKEIDDYQTKILSELTSIRNELKNYHEENGKIKQHNEVQKYAMFVVSCLIAFILWKIKIIPFVAPFLAG